MAVLQPCTETEPATVVAINNYDVIYIEDGEVPSTSSATTAAEVRRLLRRVTTMP